MAVLSRQALRAPETFDALLEAFRRALAALPDGDLPACPRCGRFDLQLRFVADPSSRLGFAAMWSEFCTHGIRVSRVTVPEGVSFLPTDAAPEQLAKHIPPFVEIGPSGAVEQAGGGAQDRDLAIARLLSRRGPLTARQIADELALRGDVVARLDDLVKRGVVARAGDGEAPTGIEPVYTALQAAA